jgi:hypothetical protein
MRPSLSIGDWVFIGCTTVLGTIVYSTIIVLVVRPFVSEAVFAFLNLWVTVACVPLLVWLARRYVLSRKVGGGFQ